MAASASVGLDVLARPVEAVDTGAVENTQVDVSTDLFQWRLYQHAHIHFGAPTGSTTMATKMICSHSSIACAPINRLIHTQRAHQRR